MKTLLLRCLAGLAALPLLISCTKQSYIDTLYMRMNQNERQVQALSSQIGTVEQVLPGQADMWAQMQAMKQELNALRGQVDEMNAKGAADSQSELARLRGVTERLEVALRQMAAELGMQVEALNAPSESGEYTNMQPSRTAGTVPSTSSTLSANASPSAGTGAVTPPPAAQQNVDTATALYDSGMKAFSDRRYKDAIKIFGDFTQSFPSHKLASNAFFWRGESAYQAGEYGAAALAYQQVLEKYPGSAKFQSAMLKQGMAFHAAGKKDAARLRLEELIKKYPSSSEAGRAKKFLQSNK